MSTTADELDSRSSAVGSSKDDIRVESVTSRNVGHKRQQSSTSGISLDGQ